MNLFDFLITPAGQELVHGVILVLNLAVLFVTRRNAKHSATIEQRLDRYVYQLMHQIHGGHQHT